MGPTGTPTEIPTGETVLLAGGGLGNAVLFSIAAALKAARQSRALLRGLQAGQRSLQAPGHRGGLRRRDLERRRRGRPSRRDGPQDRSDRRQRRAGDGGATAADDSGRRPCPCPTVDRIIAIGSDRMMNARARGARHRAQGPAPRPDHMAIGSINSPMQCMLKEVCSQCLQRHVDPATGQGQPRVQLLQPGPVPRPGRLRASSRAGFARTPRPRSSRRCGSTTCSSSARCRWSRPQASFASGWRPRWGAPSRRPRLSWPTSTARFRKGMCYDVYMKSRRLLGVRAMRQDLSVYLRRASSGETFEVTSRGRPVAVLAPPESGARPSRSWSPRAGPVRPRATSWSLAPPETGAIEKLEPGATGTACRAALSRACSTSIRRPW